MEIKTKRINEDPDPADGTRVLVDRLWPRGVSKEDAALDEWMKALAPSDELREWFDHDPDRWGEFVWRYHDELATREEQVERLRSMADGDTVTLLYAASDTEHNDAVGLKEHLDSDRYPFQDGTGTPITRSRLAGWSRAGFEPGENT